MKHDYYVDSSYVEYGWSRRMTLSMAAQRWAHDEEIVRWCRRELRRSA